MFFNLLGVFTALYSQEDAISFYPDQFGTTTQTLSLTNPVYYCIDPFNGIKVGSKNNTGQFNEIRTIYVQGIFELKQENNNHLLGVNFVSEQEGPVIRKNRMHFNYALKKELQEGLSISFGTHIGLASYDYNGSQATTQGASIGPDGSIAVLTEWKKWKTGIHLNQIFNQLYKPKTVTFSFPTYFGYYLEKSWDYPSGDKLKIFHSHNFFGDKANPVSLGLNYEYRHVLGVIVNYHYNRFITPTVCFPLGKSLNSSRLFFSYNFPVQEMKESRISSIELGLMITFSK